MVASEQRLAKVPKWLEPFVQQRLRTLRPDHMVNGWALAYLTAGLAFIAVGLVYSPVLESATMDLAWTYTNCSGCEGASGECHCNHTFALNRSLEPPILFYYRLRGYFQNTKFYFRSRDDGQLMGFKDNILHPDKDCEPYRLYSRGKYKNVTVPIAPCGVQANALFNDSFRLFRRSPAFLVQDSAPVELANSAHLEVEGIERNDSKILGQFAVLPRHANPKDASTIWKKTGRPPAWSQAFYDQIYRVHGNDWGPFLVWMEAAALPNFQKLWGVLLEHLPNGTYTVSITYRYPVSQYGGSKAFVLSTRSVGGSHAQVGVLGKMFWGLGILLCVLGFLFCYLSFHPRRSAFRWEAELTPPPSPRPTYGTFPLQQDEVTSSRL